MALLEFSSGADSGQKEIANGRDVAVVGRVDCDRGAVVDRAIRWSDCAYPRPETARAVVASLSVLSTPLSIGTDWPAVDLSALYASEPVAGEHAEYAGDGLLPRLQAVPVRISVEQEQLDAIEAVICAKPWPCDQAIAVARCESSLDPSNISPDGENFGLFQINAVHRGRVRGDLSLLLDAATNTATAYAIWTDNAGWGPWSCRSAIR